MSVALLQGGCCACGGYPGKAGSESAAISGIKGGSTRRSRRGNVLEGDSAFDILAGEEGRLGELNRYTDVRGRIHSSGVANSPWRLGAEDRWKVIYERGIILVGMGRVP